MVLRATSIVAKVNTQNPGQPVPLTPQEEGFLRALTQAMLTVPRVLDADLVREQAMSMNEYTVLMHLSEAPERQLSMGELAGACALSLSGMTRIIHRLEDQGLVCRERSGIDGRSRSAVLTESGLKRLSQAWPTHLASVRRHVFNHLQAVDLPAATTVLKGFVADAPTTPQQ